ncbi:LamG domain-containing protein [Paenibacillus hexagrammi]|uniref:LamG domain-containing protein n=1 Tax=Paenibacillus hexagrammi TaxID=2908839 RepID=A0ABY3SL83_9BACL|nr:LamG domain-containing protein [Paenibacillus sp. YPD9-1]UJF34823.1 LamG domain-containing protein [Paenibacillus sp. YPD9-1]
MVTMTRKLAAIGLTAALLFTFHTYSAQPAYAAGKTVPAIGLPLEGLEAWYKLDEEEGSITAADSSGNGHDAPAVSGTWMPTGGVDGGALTLNGTSQMIQPNTSDSTFLKNAFSVHSAAFWFQADDTASRQVLYERGGNTAGMAVQLNGNKLEAAVANAGVMNVVSIDFTDTASWHHVVASFNNGVLRLYLDGQLAGEKLAGYTSVSSALNEAGIGARYGVDAFGGSKGELGFMANWTMFVCIRRQLYLLRKRSE